jgi:hypothetical protein
MMGIPRNYSLDDVIASVDGRRVTEYAKGDAIAIALDDVDFKATQGMHDSVVFSSQPNSIATVTLKIMQGSPTNKWLSAIANRMHKTHKGFFDLAIQDAMARGSIFVGRGAIEKRPDMAFADEAGAVEWVFKMHVRKYEFGTQDEA